MDDGHPFGSRHVPSKKGAGAALGDGNPIPKSCAKGTARVLIVNGGGPQMPSLTSGTLRGVPEGVFLVEQETGKKDAAEKNGVKGLAEEPPHGHARKFLGFPQSHRPASCPFSDLSQAIWPDHLAIYPL